MTGSLTLKPYVILMAIGAFLFIPFLGRVHLFDWDEINFAESAREMLVTGDYSRVMIDYKLFWEKPPLFFWLQAASMTVFGINEFAARFPNAVCGIITLCLIFYLGRKYFDDTFGWLWVLVYVGSFLPHLYFKSGIIDPWFNLFIFSGIILFIAASEQNFSTIKHFVLSGILIGLGILTKGPVALLITILVGIISWFLCDKDRIHLKSLAVSFIAAIFTSSIWFAVEVFQNGTGLIAEFIRYQVELFSTGVAGHGGPFYYHFIVLLIGCFPASIIALGFFFEKYSVNKRQDTFDKWMIVLLVVVLILFSIVKTKIIHYSSLCYLPLTFLAAREIYFRTRNEARFPNSLLSISLLIGIIAGSAAAMLPLLGNDVSLFLPYIQDAMTKASLEARVDWPLSLMAVGIGYLALVIAVLFRMRSNFRHGVILLFAGTCIFIQSVLFSFVPRIERYTQGSVIDFYKSLQGKDVYVEVLEFKSYAHLFYSRKLPQQNQQSSDKNWLLNGDIDKPAYFVCKITKAEKYRALPRLTEVGEKNGFVFFKRELDQDF